MRVWKRGHGPVYGTETNTCAEGGRSWGFRPSGRVPLILPASMVFTSLVAQFRQKPYSLFYAQKGGFVKAVCDFPAFPQIFGNILKKGALSGDGSGEVELGGGTRRWDVCFVFWADRGPGASCPYGEGPRRALVTFPRWKVTRGQGGAAPQSYLQARFNVSRRRRLLDRDGAAPQSYLQARFDVSPPQAAFGPGWRSAPQISSNKYRHPQPAGGSYGGLALRFLNVRRRCPPFLLTEGGRAC